jgi:hypothetical protein
MKTITIVCCCIMTAAALQAQIIHVPGDSSLTIQEGIDKAHPGDTVLVADGIYYQQISFKGKKPLTVASQFLMDGDTNHIASTIINGDSISISNPDSASVVYFISGEDTTSVLCGFTITQGKGTKYTSSGYIFRAGGGVFISGSGAKVIHNHITGNHLNDTFPGSAQVVTGAGLEVEWMIDDHWVVIDNNVIDNNSCNSSGREASAAGLAIYCNSRITNNTIADNICTGMASCHAVGTGFICSKNTTWPNHVTAIIQHNLIKNNLSEAQNYMATGAGGLVQAVNVIFSENEVSDNIVNNIVSTLGGFAGLYLYQPDSGSVVRNNVFKGNISNKYCGGLGIQNNVNLDNRVMVENNYFLDNSAGSAGGAVDADRCQVFLQNNVFNGNHAQTGGAVYLHYLGTPVDHNAILVNNSFAFNSSSGQGSVVYSVNDDPLIFNCIFSQNSSVFNTDLSVHSGTVEIAYSNVDTNRIEGTRIIGAGVINVNPSFFDTVWLSLNDGSPCKNAATEVYTCHCGDLNNCPHFDITGTARPLNGGYDMGAYEDIMTGVPGKGTLNGELRITNVPNPFTASTTFRFELKEPGQVNLQIFNNFGQQVAELVNALLPAGKQGIQWNGGNLTSGMYYYRIESGRLVGSGKVIKW